VGGRLCENVTMKHGGEIQCVLPPMQTSAMVPVELHVLERLVDSGGEHLLTRSTRPSISDISFTYVSMYHATDTAVYYGLDLAPFSPPSQAGASFQNATGTADSTPSGLADQTTSACDAASASPASHADSAPAFEPTASWRTEGSQVVSTPIPAAQTLVRAGVPLKGTVLAMCTHRGLLFIGGSLQASSHSYSKFVTSWDGRQEQPLGFGLDGPVRVLLPLGPDLLVAGSFTRAYQSVAAGGGTLLTGGAALWNAKGWRLLAGAPLAASVTTATRNLSTLFVAGSFRHGVPDGCVGLCALSLDASDYDVGFSRAEGESAWSDVGGGVWGGAIWTMSLVHGHGLVVGGSFAAVGGAADKNSMPDGLHSMSGKHQADTVRNSKGRAGDSGGGAPQQARSALAHLSLWNGHEWRSLGTVSNAVRATAVLGEHLYVGGDFLSVEDLPATYFARRHMASGVWSTLEAIPALNGPVRAFSLLGSCIYLGGAFTSPSPYVTRYCLGRDQAFDAVPGTQEVGPVNVMASASELTEAANVASLPKDLVCRLTGSWQLAPGCSPSPSSSPLPSPGPNIDLAAAQGQPLSPTTTDHLLSPFGRLSTMTGQDSNGDGVLDFDELVRHQAQEDNRQ